MISLKVIGQFPLQLHGDYNTVALAGRRGKVDYCGKEALDLGAQGALCGEGLFRGARCRQAPAGAVALRGNMLCAALSRPQLSLFVLRL